MELVCVAFWVGGFALQLSLSAELEMLKKGSLWRMQEALVIFVGEEGSVRKRKLWGERNCRDQVGERERVVDIQFIWEGLTVWSY